jgi:hypothetical protein
MHGGNEAKEEKAATAALSRRKRLSGKSRGNGISTIFTDLRKSPIEKTRIPWAGLHQGAGANPTETQRPKGDTRFKPWGLEKRVPVVKEVHQRMEGSKRMPRGRSEENQLLQMRAIILIAKGAYLIESWGSMTEMCLFLRQLVAGPRCGSAQDAVFADPISVQDPLCRRVHLSGVKDQASQRIALRKLEQVEAVL